MDNLESCPFCGGEAKIAQTGYGTLSSNSAKLMFQIRCAKCGATAPGACGYIAINLSVAGELNPWHDDRPSAIEAWNRRVADE